MSSFVTSVLRHVKIILLAMAWSLLRHKLPEPDSSALTEADMDALANYLTHPPCGVRGATGEPDTGVDEVPRQTNTKPVQHPVRQALW